MEHYCSRLDPRSNKRTFHSIMSLLFNMSSNDLKDLYNNFWNNVVGKSQLKPTIGSQGESVGISDLAVAFDSA
jgi:hypothetical protein